jgi:hypothetical protein
LFAEFLDIGIKARNTDITAVLGFHDVTHLKLIQQDIVCE